MGEKVVTMKNPKYLLLLILSLSQEPLKSSAMKNGEDRGMDL